MHQIYLPALEYAKQSHNDIIGWAPLLYTKNGRPLFNTTKLIKADGRFVSVFSVKPVYYEAHGGYWRPLSEITSYHGNKRIELNDQWRKATPRFIDWLSKRQKLYGRELLLPTPFGSWMIQDYARPTISIGLTTTTVYPDPDTETSTFDGGIGNTFGASGGSISAAQSTTTTTNKNDSAVRLQDNDYGETAGYVRAPSGQHYPFRAGILFDTSAIGTDSVDSGSLTVYSGAAKADAMNDAYSYIGLVAFTPASNTGWTSSDITFSNWAVATQFATGIDITSWDDTTGNPNSFTLNSSGLAAINTSGITKLALMDGHDIQSQNWTGGTRNSFVVASSAEASGTSTDPKLIIVHTASGGGINSNFLMFM